MSEGGEILFLLPVRRRFAMLTASWICGIYAAQAVCVPVVYGCVLCALLFFAALSMRRQRRSALLFACACLMVGANTLTGWLIAIRDIPTPPQTPIRGVVSRIESDFRVTLSDVQTRGCSAPVRDVVVTLMLDEEEAREPVRVGQHVAGTGRLFAPDEAHNPGGVDWRIYALGKGYELSGYILPGWRAEGEEVFSLVEWFRQLRMKILRRLEEVFGERAAFLQGVMLGDRDAMDEGLVTAMQMTGTVHILTVSGLHMSMLAVLIGLFLRPLPVGRCGYLLLQSGILLFFAFLTGGAAGTQRAVIMATLRELARCRGKRYEPLTALGTAALVMTAINPLIALGASFQFSFFVVLGMQLIGKNADVWIRRHVSFGGLLHDGLSSLAAALSAQIAAIPMNLLFYGYVPLLSLPMNLLGSIMLPSVMIGGWATLLFSCLQDDAARAAAFIPDVAAEMFEQISLFAGSLRSSILRLPSPWAVTMIPVIALMMLVSRRLRFGGKRGRAALAALLAIVLLYAPRFDPRERYMQADVGQGDGAVIRSGRRAVLIDIGPGDSYDVIRYLRHEGLLLDAVILSHLDEDHAGALVSLLDSEIEVPAIVLGEGAVTDEEAPEVLAALAQAAQDGTQIRVVNTGDEIVLPWMTADVYVPDASHQGSNERSMLVRVCLGGRSILFAGDMPMESEPPVVPDSDILKVAHHGSRYATSRAFLEMAQPEIAVISVGRRNSYGHPTKRVLDDLAAAGAQIYRTDEQGSVIVWLDEEEIRVQTWTDAP